MKKSLFALSSAVLVLSAVTACKSSNGSGSSADACGAYFDAYNAYFQQCAPADKSVFGDRDRFEIYCQLLIAAPGAANAASSLSDCASDVAGLTSTCGSTDDATACQINDGTLASGAPCGSSIQCASGFCKSSAPCGVCADKIAVGQPCDQSSADECVDNANCVSAGNGTDGTCVAQAKNPMGGNCGTVTDTCAANLRCDDTTKKCVALSDSGGVCEEDQDCAYPLICTSDYKCASPSAVGAACTQDPLSGKSGCARSLVCDPTSHTCSSITAVGSGGVCDDVSHVCTVGSCKFGTLSTDGGAGTGICQTIIADGAPCNAANEATTCDLFADCINGICTVFDPSTCK